jgi:hypothetical protein
MRRGECMRRGCRKISLFRQQILSAREGIAEKRDMRDVFPAHNDALGFWKCRSIHRSEHPDRAN